jgi:hypothetical protein
MRSFLLDPTDAPDFEVVYTIHGVYEVGASNVLKLDLTHPKAKTWPGPSSPGRVASSSGPCSQRPSWQICSATAGTPSPSSRRRSHFDLPP